MNIINELQSLLPTYSTTLPFSKLDVEFSPFKVKDLKNISIILQEDNKKLAFISLVNILKSNVKIPEKDILNLSIGDAEYLFLQIRAKSIEENINLIYNNKKIKVNISEIKYKNSIQSKDYEISDTIKFVLKTPSLKDLLKLENFDNTNYIKSCIDKIIVKNEIYDKNKFIPEEIKQILENLPIKSMNSMEDFILNEPKLFVEFKDEDTDELKEVSGILNFFTFR